MSIQDFISSAAANLGEGEQTVKSATGSLLGLIQQNADGADFSQLLAKIPGAEGLVQAGEQATEAEGGGGLLGGLAGMAKSALGGKLGGAVGAAGAIQALAGSGLDTSKIGGFVSQFFSFASDKAGSSVVSNLLTKLPDLAKLVK